MNFDQKYNSTAFSAFLRAFLPEDYVENEKDIADISRAKIITGARELGYAPSLDVYVLEMTHAKETDPRVSIATDAFKILATFGYDKALVIFKNDESENYRFSYLTISLDLDEKGKVTQRYSNARRYSFYLGRGAKTRTPEQQLLKRGRVKDVDDLLGRFSLEVVNKEFYLQVAKAFDALVDRTGAPNLMLPSVSDQSINVYKDFAVRLIGRLMFCWFLKQKKTDSGQLIPDEILSLRAIEGVENYYHSVLEPLFFEVLNTHQDEREIRSAVFDRVPYLNGGLFSPQYNDYYELDRAIYVSRHVNTLIIKNDWFKDFFGLLETYNFTIDENTVFDQELSVDPEMLGRIFENLLAEINPETGSTERKRTGSFYTPRQIVEYMVDHSLQEYLAIKTSLDEEEIKALISYDQNDDLAHPLGDAKKMQVIKAITNLRILDPACGSGAFPIGILQKIVYILQQVDPECELWVAEKIQAVPDLWRRKIQEYYASHPPNYIRKLDVIKSSIFGVDIQHIAVEVSRLRCFLTLMVESHIDDKLPNRGIEPLPNLDFKFVCANTLVTLPNVQSNGLFDDHAGIQELHQVMSEYFSATNSKKEATKLRFLQSQKEIMSNAFAAFGGSTGELTQKLTQWDPFSNKSSGWFDPKWMFGLEEKFDVVIGNPPYKVILKDEEGYPYFKKHYHLSKGGKLNLYRLFFEAGLLFLTEEGALSYISPDNYLSSKDSVNLRKELLGKHTIISIIDYTERDKVFQNVTQAVAVIVLRNNKDAEYTFQFTQYGTEHELSSETLLSKEGHFIKPLPDIIAKIESNSGTLSDIADGYQGEINVSLKKDFFTSEQHENYLPLLRGNNLGKYNLKTAIKEYCPTNIQKRDHFKIRDRVVFQAISNSGIENRIIATILDEVVLCGHSVNYIFSKKVGVSNYLLLGLLNSRLFNFYFKFFNQTNNVPIGEIKKIPIPDVFSDEKKKAIEALVIEILRERSHHVDTSNLEASIDRLVCDLYGLSAEETAAMLMEAVSARTQSVDSKASQSS